LRVRTIPTYRVYRLYDIAALMCYNMQCTTQLVYSAWRRKADIIATLVEITMVTQYQVIGDDIY